MPKYIQYLFIITLLTVFYTVKSHAAEPATVFSITGKPILQGDNLKVSTITRGFASNQPVYKAMVQTVPKALFLQVFRKSLGLTPYGIAAIAAYEAYGLFMDPETGEIVKQSSSILGSNSYFTENANELVHYVTNFSGNDSRQSMSFFQRIMNGNCDYGCSPSYSIVVEDGVTWIRADITRSGRPAWGKVRYHDSSILPPTPESTPASDDDIWQAQNAFLDTNPYFDWADALKNADGTVNPEYFPDPVFELATQTDLNLIELYQNGLLQSNDPTAPNYVSPSELQRISDLNKQLNPTPEDLASDLTTYEKQPITQSQHQENQTAAELRLETKQNQAAALLKALDIKPNDYTTASQENLDKTLELLNTTADLPTSDFNNYLNFTTSETCKTIPLPFVGAFPSTSQCDMLGNVKSFLAYFLSVLLMWNIINTVLKEAN